MAMSKPSKSAQGNKSFAINGNHVLPLVIFGGAVGIGFGAFMMRYYFKQDAVPVAPFVKVAERVAVLERQVEAVPAQGKKIVELEGQMKELELNRARDIDELKQKIRILFFSFVKKDLELCEVTAKVISQNEGYDERALDRLKYVALKDLSVTAKDLGLLDLSNELNLAAEKSRAAAEELVIEQVFDAEEELVLPPEQDEKKDGTELLGEPEAECD